jgi:hypothetical protein
MRVNCGSEICKQFQWPVVEKWLVQLGARAKGQRANDSEGNGNETAGVSADFRINGSHNDIKGSAEGPKT